jgi:capsular polysaccharide biosynthesis protein
MVSDGDATAKSPPSASADPPERLSGYDDFQANDDPPGELGTGLVSLGFITAALRRSAWLWCTTAIVGLLLGLGLYVIRPPAYQASTTILLVPSADEQSGDLILTDIAMAQSRLVAGRAVEKLGLRQSVSSFLGSYTVTQITDRVLLITADAPSSIEAKARAQALATEFLQFRAQQAQAQEQIMLAALQQQITGAQQNIRSISRQISQLAAQPISPSQQTKLSQLQAQRNQAVGQLPTLEQTVRSNQLSTRVSATQMVKGSRVLDTAAPIPHSHYKRAAIYAAVGLLMGLFLGLGIIIVRALVSDRLRRRDDVAYALGTSVKLSVGTLQVSRWRPGLRRLTGAQDRDRRRIVTYLRGALPRSAGRTATLAIVAVDNARTVAPSVVSLAMSYAQEGKQVVVADLAAGAPAARLLGADKPGIRPVRADGVHLVIAVPGRENIAPAGPVPQTSPQAGNREANEALVAAFDAADLMLTLTTLDPSLGGGHLATWATDAVVVVTAGRSSATKIHAVGEMIRLAGTRQVSAVLVGADKTDESLGVTYTPGVGRDAEVVEQGSHSGAEGFLIAVDGRPGEVRPTSDPARQPRTGATDG